MKHIILFLLILWHVSTTKYFGWNFLPQSADEYICDGIMIVGLLVYWCSLKEGE